MSSSPSTTTTMAPIPPLTLIVAATRNMGIGLNGALPWRLKNEMAYFARVTKRAPPPFQRNAVVMGRKTWESLPAGARPLAERTNAVVTRCAPDLLAALPDGVVAAASIADAAGQIRAQLGDALGRVYVIGGAELYRAALDMPEARNILLTRVDAEFECDTFFPVRLAEEGSGWVKRDWEELCAFVGEEAPKGVQEEDGVKYEFELWTNERYTARSSTTL